VQAAQGSSEPGDKLEVSNKENKIETPKTKNGFDIRNSP
jgi:hypothetical protein